MNKIVLVSNASWTMIKFRLGLMKRLKEFGYEVIVLSPKDKYSKKIEDIGCKFIDINIDNKGVNPINDFKLIYNLYKLYKGLKADLIIHYTVKPNIYGSISSMFSGTKCMSVIPGLGYSFINDNTTSKIVKILYKMALKIPKAVWFINEDDRRIFLESNLVNVNKTDMINSEGINTEYFKPLGKKSDDNKIRFLLIARILKDKGVYEYIEAAKIINKKYTNVTFQLLGPIYTLNPSSISKKEVDSWHNSAIIEYLGQVEDVRNYIADSDCVVLPSYREGKGMTLVESASMEKPIIATNVPGCKDVVDDGVNGYLCKVKNSKDLADKIEMMLNLTKDERETMGKLGRNKIKKEMDENIIIEKYLKAIKEMIS